MSQLGNPLERLLSVVNFEIFRSTLEGAFSFKSGGDKGGRPPYDSVLMFKVLVLQNLYQLSDDQTKYQIKDRLSFMRFLGLSLADRIPDAKTILLYRERIKKLSLDRGVQLHWQPFAKKGRWRISSRFGVHACLINRWKKQVLDHMEDVFFQKLKKKDDAQADMVKELHTKIGQLTVERDFLEQAFGR